MFSSREHKCDPYLCRSGKGLLSVMKVCWLRYLVSLHTYILNILMLRCAHLAELTTKYLLIFTSRILFHLWAQRCIGLVLKHQLLSSKGYFNRILIIDEEYWFANSPVRDGAHYHVMLWHLPHIRCSRVASLINYNTFLLSKVDNSCTRRKREHRIRYSIEPRTNAYLQSNA